MKSLLIAAALVAVAVAVPVLPGVAGPAPIIPDTYEPIIAGPAFVDEYQPIIAGPALVDNYEAINVGPAIVDSYVPIGVDTANVVEAVKAPVVQIILNINQQGPVVVPVPEAESAIIPEPVIVVDEVADAAIVPEPVQVAPAPAEIEGPLPAGVGTPVLPNPVINAPYELN